MAIPDSDPRAQDLDAAFAAAMSAPAKPRVEASSPPEVDHDAPHGRGEDGTPLAPYGLTKDGRPKRTKGGRPRNDDIDSPRTSNVTQLRPDGDKGKDTKEKPAARDWSGELDGLADAAWFGLSAIAKVGGGIPFVGKLVPEEKLAAQAFVLSETKPQLIGAINLAAQHNAKAAAFCAKLEGGDGLWALTAMFMVMPVLSLSATIWKGEAIETAEGMKTAADLAKLNETKMDDAVRKIQMAIAVQAELAQAAVSRPATPDTAA